MILVCGEALVDFFSADSSGPGFAMHGLPGGSPFNVALGLARFGRKVAFLGALSRDFFGERLRHCLEDEGVSIEYAKLSDKPTPLSFVSVDAQGLVAYSFRNQGAADHDLLAVDLPSSLPSEVSCVTVGSYSIGLEPTGSALVDFAERLGQDRVVSFDPNVRPSLIGDKATWKRRFDRLIEASTIVKVSMEDIGQAFGPGMDAGELAGQWLGRGVSLVVVTDGAAPVRGFGRFGRVELRGPAVEVVDTVGAGDSFHSALIAYLDRTGALSRSSLSALSEHQAGMAIAFAARAAALTCTRRGADLPRLGDLDP